MDAISDSKRVGYVVESSLFYCLNTLLYLKVGEMLRVRVEFISWHEWYVMTVRRMELKMTVRRMEIEVNGIVGIEVIEYLCPTCKRGSYLVD